MMEDKLLENNRRLKIINGFSHKIASAMELPDIYKTCVATLTELLGLRRRVSCRRKERQVLPCC